MKRIYFLALFSFVVFFSACAGNIQSGGGVAQGRQALFAGNYQVALGHFQSAAQQNPNYVYGTMLQEGVWSYIGRTQYLLGQLPQAQQTLEKALTQRKSNDVVNLYLGLTLVRLGERQKGLDDIQVGMKGIAQFINYVTQAFRYDIGQYWDPGHAIRNAIQQALALASSGNVDWQQLLTQGESIGMNFEQEPDRANAQQMQDATMQVGP
jgi:tetratricopeptide (TPR) repeat protein